MVSICSTTRMEWYISDVACTLLGITTVPIGSYMDNDSMAYILNETEASVLVCSPDVMKKLEHLDSSSLPFLKAVIVMDMYSPSDIKCLESSLALWLNVIKFTEVLSRGEKQSISLKNIHPPPSSIYTIMFTSGSTGRPKGCVFTRKTWRNRLHINFLSSKTVWVSFLEPSHLFERIMLQEFILTGGKVGFHRSSLDHLFDDFALIRPTIVTSTPRFWNLIYNQYLQALHQEYKLYLSNTPVTFNGGDSTKDTPHQNDQHKLLVHVDTSSSTQDSMNMENSEATLRPSSSGATSGSPPSEVTSGSPPSEVTSGSPPSEVTSGSLPSGATSGSPPSGATSGSPPSGATSGSPPSGATSGSPPSGATSGSPPSEVTSGSLPSGATSGPPPSGATSGSPPSGATSGSPPSEITSGSPPSKVTSGSPPSGATSGSPPSDATSFDPGNVPEGLRKAVLKRFRSILGGRQTLVSTGGAPMAAAVKRFLEECFDGLFHEGYGATEVGGISNAGSVISDAKVKLVDVPEMGYLTTDSPPRGEICVQTTAMVDGYYKNDVETAEKFVDGYFRTGDIGVMESPDKVRIIDRKKNLFKLAQGEFVSPERLENLYVSASPLIEQVYVYGNSLQMNIVAVVVPHADSLVAWWTSNSNDTVGTSSSVQELCNMAVVKKLYLEEMQSCANRNGLKGWEVPIGLILEPEVFTEKNGLLTSALKLCRPNLEKKYRSLLEGLYNHLSCAERPLEVLIVEYFQKLANLTPALLPECTPPPPLPPNLLSVSFTQLGGDSISAMRLANLFDEHFNKLVSVQAIMTEPLKNILQLVLIKTPGVEVQTSYSIDWKKEIILDFSGTHSHKHSSVPVLSECNTVLLTGATGFLGQFILLELLTNPKCNLIYCLVRSTKESSNNRIQLMLNELDQHFKIGKWSTKVMVVNGDLCSPNLGLSEEDYSLICDTVNVIIHNGAVVNAALPYQALMACNVGSTKEVIKMACNGCPKFLHYVSTIGVFASATTSEPISEDSGTPIDRLHELSGYAQSKWVAEMLVLSAIEKGFISGSICRPGLIGPHSVSGHANPQDWVCWLVRGLARLERYPVGPGCDEVIHFIPVDYVAKAIVYFSMEAHRQHRVANIFHVVNDSYPIPYAKLIAKLRELFVPKMESCSYGEFRAMLTAKAKALEDPVLCAVDLLLPKTGGWSRSHNLKNKKTRDFLARGGIIYSIDKDDQYIQMYLSYLSSKGLFE
ncbi:hypothetical protein EMCRGX_G018193 [Ephydatia muelleri]